ncbi:FliA/WhiG family RNA polymerase sigma factor [Pantoea sp. NPDC088449]|uniref:RNA polymerase, sigma 28 subunit, SigD/FliA/WhiG n=1 Tax=Candidatus Pantoea floridensis TaxID=1938870 RepID=A0A286BVA9_9GAMM|nr:FliA/WhiG family RNA polymerase sigma factor [Pantoea floridensis]PIF13975.1 RNA polymerase sigma-28 (SigD/FliA/WhiG) subunit [Enterobacteriaceae bacterium JKS000233]SOD38074.1 RNA polymerase, sigma 28 subunit, SigD/FliA/WhiG [Pantoea floridensis]HBZ14918.1 FliA/WhiG family RNA polymerase sigma factor [Pantoea sp.]
MSVFNEVTELTPVEETRYLQQWQPLVKRVVRQLSAQTDAVMDRGDLEQIAFMGLLESLRRYGRPDDHFAGYALQRVRGAVLDQLRLHDWRPRRLRQKTHKINDAVRALTRRLGHEPNEEELRRHLKLSPEEVQEYLLLESASAMESFDDLLAGEALSSVLSGRALEEEISIQRTLKTALASLSEREQLILSLYYQHEMSLKEIALVLELTEARVCQINKKIGVKIKQFFE